MNILLRALAVSLTLFALASCTTVTTLNPIGIAKGEVMDERLLGAWNFRPSDAAAKNENAFTFVLLRESGGLSGLMVIDHADRPARGAGRIFRQYRTGHVCGALRYAGTHALERHPSQDLDGPA
jgi:hypothetical protein